MRPVTPSFGRYLAGWCLGWSLHVVGAIAGAWLVSLWTMATSGFDASLAWPIPSFKIYGLWPVAMFMVLGGLLGAVCGGAQFFLWKMAQRLLARRITSHREDLIAFIGAGAFVCLLWMMLLWKASELDRRHIDRDEIAVFIIVALIIAGTTLVASTVALRQRWYPGHLWSWRVVTAIGGAMTIILYGTSWQTPHFGSGCWMGESHTYVYLPEFKKGSIEVRGQDGASLFRKEVRGVEDRRGIVLYSVEQSDRDTVIATGQISADDHTLTLQVLDPPQTITLEHVR